MTITYPPEMLPSPDDGTEAEVICACGICTPEIQHASCCAVHNPPALPAGPCDCGAYRTSTTEPEPHPWYGGCDGFGPNGTCSECTGIVERNDGAWVQGEAVVKKPPLSRRLKAAWNALRYTTPTR